MYFLWLLGLLHHPWAHLHRFEAIPLEMPLC